MVTKRSGASARSFHNARPVTVGGVRYPSICAAARAFKINHSVVISRLHQGWDLLRALTIKPRSRGQGVAVRVGGREYPSLVAACRALGVSYSTVMRRRELGWDLERALAAPARKRDAAQRSSKRTGVAQTQYTSVAKAAQASGVDPGVARERIRRGWSPEEALSTPVPENARGKSVTILGERYPSIAAAARAHGLTRGIVQNRISQGWTLSDAVTVPAHEAPRSIPVEYRGRRFKSLTAATEALGVDRSSLMRLRKAGMSVERVLDELLAREEARAVLLGRREEFRARMRKQGYFWRGWLEVRGVKYGTVAELAHAFGIVPGTLRSRLQHGWTIEEAVGLSRRPKTVRTIVSVTVNGQRFPNIAAAARHFGVSLAVARYRLQVGATPEQAFGLEPFVACSNPAQGRSIRVAGETFCSMQQACRRFGKLPDQIRRRLRRGESPEQAFDLEPLPEHLAAVVIEGCAFRVFADAARHYGVPYTKLRYLIERKGIEPIEAVRVARGIARRLVG